jgi:hypothetical protein
MRPLILLSSLDDTPKVIVLRSKVQDLASSPLKEVIQPLHEVVGSMHRCLLRVEIFLERAVVTLGMLMLQTTLELRHWVVPDGGSIDRNGAGLYGCFSPRGRARSTVMAPVLHVMPELEELCGEPVLTLSVEQVMAGDAVVWRKSVGKGRQRDRC